MEIIKIELPRTSEPEFYCPFSGHNLVGEGLQDAIDDGYLMLAVNWGDADDYIMGNEELLEKYRNFVYNGDGDPTDRVEELLKKERDSEAYWIIELTVNAMCNGPITDTNTYVYYK